MKERGTLLQKEGAQSVVASLLSIVIGLLVGSILILVVGMFSDNLGLGSAWEGIRLVFFGIFSTGRNASGVLTWGFNPQSIGNMLFRATPLILTGLSVSVAFKTGLFNIGAPGQYLMGTLATLAIALGIPSTALPSPLIWLLAFLGGILAGALWGCIPGIVKAFLNINEVLACIMTNWIAANLVTWFFDANKMFQNTVENTKTSYIYKTAYGRTMVDGAWTYVDGNGVSTAKLGLDKLFSGSQVNAGILIAVLIAILVYILMTKTTLGYELKACGANRHAARYAGVNDKRNIVLSMAIAGALSGAGASLYYLSGNTEFFWSTYQALPATGFNGIPVALLAANNPIAVIFTGIFMSMLNIVGLQLTNLTAYNEYITDVIISVIVYLSAFSLVIKMFLTSRKKHKAAEAAAAPAAEPAPPAEPEPEPAAETPPPEPDAAEEKGGEQA
ncbi:ABC transporter permease [Vermiculatibacterium agrestimuris]|uniref:ABC transporter permease n=1 Tax=Vermiculatibacterium agrestimuris TaxID=2941519 RepID=UPI00203D8646|nr:ABC transporter permease [Vermiculatibacterium agrestimuris]